MGITRWKIVYTGEVATTNEGETLVSSPLGSCIAVCAFDPSTGVGGLAHVMLPGTAPASSETEKTRYAAHALKALLDCIQEKGGARDALCICLVGGANVLKRENDTIHRDNLDSLETLIAASRIPICRSATGGTERMTAKLDCRSGKVFITVGDSPETPLFDFNA